MNSLIAFLLSAVIFLVPFSSSYADGNSFTVNIPNNQNGYTAVVIQQSGSGYTGPQGEYYSQFPTVAQLQVMYGAGADTESNVTVTVPPPELPVYVQPAPPDSDYVWTPGYWAYDSFFEDYYWVPGTWVRPPAPGLLWTPGYWYWRDGNFVFSDGYWGPHVGFYGGVNYGHGYEGNGRSSFNGGPGGTNARPTLAEQAAMKEKHVPGTAEQQSHRHSAMQNPDLRASANHGKPAIAATARPGVFKGNPAGKVANTAMIKSGPMALPQAKPQPKIQPKPKVKKPKPKPIPPPPPNGDNTQNKNPQGST